MRTERLIENSINLEVPVKMAGFAGGRGVDGGGIGSSGDHVES